MEDPLAPAAPTVRVVQCSDDRQYNDEVMQHLRAGEDPYAMDVQDRTDAQRNEILGMYHGRVVLILKSDGEFSIFPDSSVQENGQHGNDGSAVVAS